MRRLLATAVAVLLLAGCSESGNEPEAGAGSPTTPSTTTTSSEPAETGPVVRCPRGTQEIDPALPDQVPEGATSVRLCDGGADKVTPPVDALTSDVESVVTAVNEQPLERRGCVELRIPEYQLAFGYPDGTRFVVAGRFTACAELLVGSARRAKAGPPLRTFVASLGAQRATATPPEPIDPAALDCAQPRELWTWPLADPRELAVAALCVGDPQHPGRARMVPIPPDDLETLTASMATDTVETSGMFCSAARPRYWIVGANAWGDPVTMDYGCIGLTLSGELDWTPRGPAREILRDRLETGR
ncbi:lipoprotein [Nocardioides sp. HM23]|uniref:lipoprotein n=1 Tax=Nocardioides bizhenqiangii TaxID=3095076 RepID=UPI002ACA18C2|nr:lipoprotein [Nocardioides sp. HM23]MDZ5621478.1 lipoprotein [Nocardioides sp. HM23]